jgi:hypothetical protein
MLCELDPALRQEARHVQDDLPQWTSLRTSALLEYDLWSACSELQPFAAAGPLDYSGAFAPSEAERRSHGAARLHAHSLARSRSSLGDATASDTSCHEERAPQGSVLRPCTQRWSTETRLQERLAQGVFTASNLLLDVWARNSETIKSTAGLLWVHNDDIRA